MTPCTKSARATAACHAGLTRAARTNFLTGQKMTDLARMDAPGEYELAQIAASFNGFVGKLSGMPAQLRDASRRWPKSTR